MKNLVHGVGINDADYAIQAIVDSKLVSCPFYQTWSNMLSRCYNPRLKQKLPTYIGCYVANEWLTFSNFRRWMETQDWQGKQLDKDLLLTGNKAYSPETCAFIDSITNTFTTDCASARGRFPVGVCLHKKLNKLQSQCRNPFTKKIEYLGLFICQNEAHLAWRKRKHELALQLADLQADERVAQALRIRYCTTVHLADTL